ncbi:MAG: DUF192 domain-containing protein [Gammaproteobacteria bacterium]|nr:DUF192 domain-containing protein [Gammaproteobacteria bacterium]
MRTGFRARWRISRALADFSSGRKARRWVRIVCADAVLEFRAGVVRALGIEIGSRLQTRERRP